MTNLTVKMTHKLLILACLLVCSNLLKSQNTDKPNAYLALSAGAAKPLGNFSDNGIPYETGYANSGFDISFNGNFPVGKRWGLAVQISGSRFPFNKNLDQSLLNYATDSSHLIISANAITQNLFLGGISYFVVKKEKFEVMVSLLVGISRISYPKLEVEEYPTFNPTNTIPTLENPFAPEYSWSREGLDSNGPAVGMNMTVKKNLSKKFFLLFNIGFTNAIHEHFQKEEQVRLYGSEEDGCVIPTWAGPGVICYYQYTPTLLSYQSLKFNAGIGVKL